MFVFIASTDGTDMLVNIDHILAVKETKEGSAIYMRDDITVTSSASAKEVTNAIARATTNLEVRS